MGRPKKVVEEPISTNDGIQFFGDVDLNDSNKIKSYLPAWFFDTAINEMQESVDRKKRALRNRMIKEDLIMRTEQEIKAESERLEEINKSRPRLNDTQKDKCASAYKMLSEQIADTMPTRKQSKDGLVSPHQELKRMKSKHITVDPDIAAACGVKPVGGKISGDEANRCFKILGKLLDEPTNVEHLRRDGNSEAHRSMDELTRAILKGVKLQGV